MPEKAKNKPVKNKTSIKQPMDGQAEPAANPAMDKPTEQAAEHKPEPRNKLVKNKTSTNQPADEQAVPAANRPRNWKGMSPNQPPTRDQGQAKRPESGPSQREANHQWAPLPPTKSGS